MVGRCVSENNYEAIIREFMLSHTKKDLAIITTDNPTLKRLYRDEENHQVILHPENKSMKDIIVTDCRIQGVAVHVLKSLE